MRWLPSGQQRQASFTSKCVMLNTGHALDFVVGCGRGNNMLCGLTGLNAAIEHVGEYCEYPVGSEPPC